MRFVFLNHWYPEAWAAWQVQGGPPLHGTADYWDVALRAAGHQSETIVLNEHPILIYSIAANLPPDVVCAMEVGRFPASRIREAIPNAKVVAFCSHRVEDAALQGYDVVFSSFKWMPEHCATIGVRCEYLPLAFGSPVLARLDLPKARDIPVAFVGGLGSRIWDQGTRTMAAIASAIPEFRWWGYVAANSMSDLPVPLQKAYQGEAWGRKMYEILARTKICLNRHGEIARGWGNNCRQYESLGMGCWLLTDNAGELRSDDIQKHVSAALEYSFPDVEYTTEMAITSIQHLMSSQPKQPEKAQGLILKYHTYEARVPRFLEVIESL